MLCYVDPFISRCQLDWKRQPGYHASDQFRRHTIGVGDGGTCACPSPPPTKKIRKYFSDKNHVKFGHFVNFFSGKYHVKFGNFVNFSCIYFRAKMSFPPPKVDWAPTPMRHTTATDWSRATTQVQRSSGIKSKFHYCNLLCDLVCDQVLIKEVAVCDVFFLLETCIQATLTFPVIDSCSNRPETLS